MGVGLAFRNLGDTHTHRHCQILSPLALWVGGEKIQFVKLDEQNATFLQPSIINCECSIYILNEYI